LENSQLVTTVDAPAITLKQDDPAGEALLMFFRALGWNGKDLVDRHKVHTTLPVCLYLYYTMLRNCPNRVSVSILMANIGPRIDALVEPGKVDLLDGWSIPVVPGDCLVSRR